MTGFDLSLLRSFVLAASLALLIASPAMADKRVAMIIGNSKYQSVNPLPNPAKDASAVGDMLKKAGFDVVDSRQDLSVADMKRMIRDFTDKVRDADVAVVFYAGHGIEVDGTNYILPVDTRLERDVDVEDEAISLDRLVRTVDGARKLRLIILDACRDNPFATTMKRSVATRAVSRGLGKVEPSNPNTLIAYAAKAGSTASDGDGPHSPFTTALLKQLPVPGQDLRKSLGFVRDEVMKITANKQEPFVYGSLGGDDVVLVPAAAQTSPVPAQVSSLDPNSQLRRDYELAAQVNTKPAWDAFIANYPKGFYADLARAARAKLLESANTKPAALPDQRTAAAASIASYAGKSYRLAFSERQEELTPNEGKVALSPREIVIFVKSPTELVSRLTQFPADPARRSSRFVESALGSVDKGVQINFDKQLDYIAMTGGGSFRVHAVISADGNSCRGDVKFELSPGKSVYEVRRIANGDPVTLKSITAERLVCWVLPGDAVGPPPELPAAARSAPK